MFQYLEPWVKPSFSFSSCWYLASSALYCALCVGAGGAGGGEEDMGDFGDDEL